MSFISENQTQDESGNNSLIIYSPDIGDNIPKDKVCLLSLEDASNLNIVYKWRITDVLGVGESLIIVGQSGAGKSTLSTYMAFQLLTKGEKFLDTFEIDENNRPERILIVQAENTMAAINKHVKQIIEKRPNYAPAKKNIKFLSLGNSGRFSADLSEDRLDLKLLVEAINYFKPQVVIVDPLQCYNSRDENNSIAMRRFLDTLQTIVEAVIPDANLVITHHDGKVTDKKSAGRGSSAITDWSANFIRVQKKDGKRDEIIITFGKTRNAADNDEKYLFKREGSIFIPINGTSSANTIMNKYGLDNVNEYQLIMIDVLLKNNNRIETKGTFVSLVCREAEQNKCKKTSSNPIREEIDIAINNKIIVEHKVDKGPLYYTVEPTLYAQIMNNTRAVVGV